MMEDAGVWQMFKQLMIGSVVIAITVAIHAELLALLRRNSPWMVHSARARIHRFADTALIMFGVLYVLFAHTVEVWLWAFVLMATGAVAGLEPAVYFSLVCFTTLGFGDITLPVEWRLLSALIGANGFLLFGWSTAYMFELMRRFSGSPS